jgi:hypothetical protein
LISVNRLLAIESDSQVQSIETALKKKELEENELIKKVKELEKTVKFLETESTGNIYLMGPDPGELQQNKVLRRMCTFPKCDGSGNTKGGSTHYT